MPRIALVQMQCEKAAVAQNLQQIAHHLAQAAARDVDILGLPEMCLTGYADPTRYPQAILRLDGPEVDQLLAASKPYATTALVGLIEENPGARPYITHLVIRRGALLGAYRKVTIKDEETDWFSPGLTIPVFQAPTSTGDLTFGIAICADIDNESVFAACRRQGAEIVFELAAPGLYGEQATRDWQSGYRWWETSAATSWAATPVPMPSGSPPPPRPAAPSTRTSPAVAIFLPPTVRRLCHRGLVARRRLPRSGSGARPGSATVATL